MTVVDLGAELAAGLSAGPPPPTGPGVVGYVGGRRALTVALSGMGGTPKRGDYSSAEGYAAARRVWRTAARRAQRYDDEGRAGRQVRGRTRVALTPAQRRRVREAGEARRSELIGRRGLRARLHARLVVDSPNGRGGADVRVRTLPAFPGPGVLIDGPTWREIRSEAAGDVDQLGELFWEAFLESYGMPLETEIGEVSWLRVWPEGEPEPA